MTLYSTKMCPGALRSEDINRDSISIVISISIAISISTVISMSIVISVIHNQDTSRVVQTYAYSKKVLFSVLNRCL